MLKGIVALLMLARLTEDGVLGQKPVDRKGEYCEAPVEDEEGRGGDEVEFTKERSLLNSLRNLMPNILGRIKNRKKPIVSNQRENDQSFLFHGDQGKYGSCQTEEWGRHWGPRRSETRLGLGGRTHYRPRQNGAARGAAHRLCRNNRLDSKTTTESYHRPTTRIGSQVYNRRVDRRRSRLEGRAAGESQQSSTTPRSLQAGLESEYRVERNNAPVDSGATGEPSGTRVQDGSPNVSPALPLGSPT